MPPARTGRELLVALAIALAAGGLYALTFQRRFFGDGSGLYSMHVLGSRELYVHVLYLPACRLLQHAFALSDPGLAPRLVSILPAALAAGFAWLIVRRTGASWLGALMAVGFFVLSPTPWFFGTTVEVHALLLGVVAGLTTLVLYAPWQRPGLALTLVALAFPLLFLAHEAAFTLGPGFVLLVQYARARRARPFGWPALLGGVGPLLLAALGVGVVLSFLLRYGTFASIAQEVRWQLEHEDFKDRVGVRPVCMDEWILPFGLWLPLALVGLARLRRERWLQAAVLVTAVVPTVFFLWWGVFENGAYFLGCSPLLLVPLAHLFPRWSPRAAALALALVALQGAWGHHRLRAWDTGWDPAERAAQARLALGESGMILLTADFAPDIRCDLPQFRSFSLTDFVRNTFKQANGKVPPEVVLERIRPVLERILARNERVAVELGYARVPFEDSSTIYGCREALAAIEAWLRASYAVRELPHPYWPMIVLSPRG